MMYGLICLMSLYHQFGPFGDIENFFGANLFGTSNHTEKCSCNLHHHKLQQNMFYKVCVPGCPSSPRYWYQKSGEIEDAEWAAAAELS